MLKITFSTTGWIFVIYLALIQSCYCYTKEALADEITKLPGMPQDSPLLFRQFSGYFSVTATRKLHYWFVESKDKPEKSPIAFWTNGGPGCSGLIGFFTEQGPFRPNADLSITLNEYSWNENTNMVFIEAPCGVGFSYSTERKSDDDYNTGDYQTAEDNYKLIQDFFIRFPEYKSNELYLASESYGGHYIPTLASTIIKHNKNGIFPFLNLKGIAIGNPYVNPYSAEESMFETYWGHQILSKPVWDNYLLHCKKSANQQSRDCVTATEKIRHQASIFNAYALDFPLCVSKNDVANKGLAQRSQLKHYLNQYYQSQQLDSETDSELPSNPKSSFSSSSSSVDVATTTSSSSSLPPYQPCEDNYAATYLNNRLVKEAIHVNTGITWKECSDRIQYNVTDMVVSMVPLYKELLLQKENNLRVMIFSGDDDSVCSTLGTQSWIWELGYQISDKHSWQPYYVNQQPSGYISQWEDVHLVLVTVHGAGHEVPAYKPEIALHIWERFLQWDFKSNE